MTSTSHSLRRQSPARELIDLTATLKGGQTDLQPTQGIWKPALAGLLAGQVLGAVGGAILSILTGCFVGHELLYEANLLGASELLTLLLFALSWLSHTQRRRGPKSRPLWQALALHFGAAAVIVSAMMKLSAYLFFVVDLPWSQLLPMGQTMIWAPAIATTLAVGAYGGAVVLKKVLAPPQGDREDRLFQILTRALPFGTERDDARLAVEDKGWSLQLPLRGGGALSLTEHAAGDPPHGVRVQLTDRTLHPEGIDWSGQWKGQQIHHRLVNDRTMLLSAGETPMGNAALASVLARLLERAGVPEARAALSDHGAELRLTRPHGEALPPEAPLRRAPLVAPLDPGFEGPGLLKAARRWVGRSFFAAVLLNYIVTKGVAGLIGFVLFGVVVGGGALPLTSFVGTFIAAIVFALCVQSKSLRLVPRKRRLPPRREAHVVQQGERLYLSDEPAESIDLSRPFSLNLTRSPHHEAPTQVGISLGQRDAETGEHRTWSVSVRVRDEATVEALPELSLSAPTVVSEAFGGWLWPLIRYRAGLHGPSVPWDFEQGAAIQSAPEVVQAGAARAGTL